jgi:NtrC-family two-component system response regulator AlgB
MNHEVTAVADCESALEELKRREFDLAMLDLYLGNENGLDLLPQILRAANRPNVVVMTAHASYETAVEAVRRGAFDYFPKPCTPDEVRALLSRVARMQRWRRKSSNPDRSISGVGPDIDLSSSSPAMIQAVRMAMQAAESEATTLLLGETGTGKSVLARAIHQRSERSRQPFVTISCPCLSGQLFESELFGHVKGAFTGAHVDTWGKVAMADGGTLFFDEIGDLPLRLQAKLLRLLQEGEYERVGETQVRYADVRIIAATNHNLKLEAAEHRFREDLYYRVSIMPITLPPLRERSCDLPHLAERLLEFFSAPTGTPPPVLSSRAIDLLQRYPWPGNLRELRNLLERAVILRTAHIIDAEDLTPQLQSDPEIHLGSRQSLAQIEAEHIRRVIANTGSLEEAATVLEIDPATLYRKRKRLAAAQIRSK